MLPVLQVLILSAALLQDRVIFVQCDGDVTADDATDGEDAATGESLMCYQCDDSGQCSTEQNQENGTSTECESGHCWIVKLELNEEITYRRECGDNCTEESRELDCRTSDNRTECTRCCSDRFCNYGLLNGSTKMSAHHSFNAAAFAVLLIYAHLAWIAT